MVTLSDVFPRVASKQLAAVDLPHLGSNQHELNGVQALREFFETGERLQETIHLHLYRDETETQHDTTEVTFYDSREKSAHRSPEWRLYYRGDFLAAASPGDMLILARTRDGELHGFVFQEGSGWLSAARALFPLEGQETKFSVISADALSSATIALAERRILAELGIDVAIPTEQQYEGLARSILQAAGDKFPSTKQMSLAARESVRVDVSDVDSAICYWLDAEEQLFYAMETILLGERLKSGFVSVDAFIELAQSALQRRKSRMGHSLQHHAQEVFILSNLNFTPQARTERKNRPDFLFPGESEYRDKTVRPDQLTMLAAKSTCKDRWRQILTEAEQIPRKHLLTLDQALSADQIDEMQQSSVALVIPAPLQKGYDAAISRHFMTLSEFVEHVRQQQSP